MYIRTCVSRSLAAEPTEIRGPSNIVAMEIHPVIGNLDKVKSHGRDGLRGRANPYDNASCESFIKMLKRERSTRTNTTISARGHLAELNECYYNQKRLHSALGLSFGGRVRQKSTTRQQSKQYDSDVFSNPWKESLYRATGEGTPRPSLSQKISILLGESIR